MFDLLESAHCPPMSFSPLNIHPRMIPSPYDFFKHRAVPTTDSLLPFPARIPERSSFFTPFLLSAAPADAKKGLIFGRSCWSSVQMLVGKSLFKCLCHH